MPRPRDQQLVSSYRTVLDQHHRLTCALTSALAEHDLGMSEFEVLEHLSERDCPLRIQELAELVHLSQSALSRVVARLEADGLAMRAMCPEDRRGIAATITDAGRERLDAARPAQRRALADVLGG